MIKRKPRSPPFLITPGRLKAPKIKTGEKAWNKQMKAIIDELQEPKRRNERE